MELCRERGMRVGLIRPITLWPYPYAAVADAATRAKGFLVVEMNAGQMIEDVRLAVGNVIPVRHFGRMGGIVPSPEDIVSEVEKLIASVTH